MIPKIKLNKRFTMAGKRGFASQREQSQLIHECDLDEVVNDIEKAVNEIALDYRRIKGFILVKMI